MPSHTNSHCQPLKPPVDSSSSRPAASGADRTFAVETAASKALKGSVRASFGNMRYR